MLSEQSGTPDKHRTELFVYWFSNLSHLYTPEQVGFLLQKLVSLLNLENQRLCAAVLPVLCNLILSNLTALNYLLEFKGLVELFSSCLIVFLNQDTFYSSDVLVMALLRMFMYSFENPSLKSLQLSSFPNAKPLFALAALDCLLRAWKALKTRKPELNDLSKECFICEYDDEFDDGFKEAAPMLSTMSESSSETAQIISQAFDALMNDHSEEVCSLGYQLSFEQQSSLEQILNELEE
jgi:hypothetical protein